MKLNEIQYRLLVLIILIVGITAYIIKNNL